MNKKWIGLIAAAALVIVVLLVQVGLMIGEYNDNTSKDKQQVVIKVAEGSTIDSIANQLKKEGVIRSKFVFKQKVKALDYGPLQFGEFTLDTGWSLKDVIKTLATEGQKKESFSFVVPEGYSVEQICAKAVKNEICTEQEFYEVLEHGTFPYSFLNEIPTTGDYTYRLQGFLFPDTYLFDSDTDAYILIDTMLKEFEQHYLNLKNIPSEHSFYEIITAASLVERESKLDEERATIAGVIYNRVGEDMLLQIDASVVYACSEGLYDMDQVLYKDLEIDSPYNTYKYAGLPAGPICNPGIASVKAALVPEQHSYYFYHTDEEKKDGSHIFTETFEEHTATMSNGE